MIHNVLKGRKLVLASMSPRRIEIFSMLGLKPIVDPAHIHEPLEQISPSSLVNKHSRNKVICVKNKYDSDTIVVAADTIVYLDKTILGKPETPAIAEKYLSLLSGNTHIVYTSISISYKNVLITDFEKSTVAFKILSPQEIDSYIETKEPFDKAGAYGIQGYGSQFIKRINGCYFNVMGFPVNLFYEMLNRIFRG